MMPAASQAKTELNPWACQVALGWCSKYDRKVECTRPEHTSLHPFCTDTLLAMTQKCLCFILHEMCLYWLLRPLAFTHSLNVQTVLWHL